MLVLMPLIAFADDDKPINVNELPARAKEIIDQHFADSRVSLATVEREVFNTSYEVFFTDGNKIEFDKNGEWKEINCKFSRVPETIIPEQITTFVTKNHEGRYIKEIDKDKHDYEVKLDNGLELKFDLKYNLICYDD
jgi:hypothetical protein